TANSDHHRKHDAWFLSESPSFKGDESVLDLGCGNGDFTKLLADQVPRGEVIGLDASADLLDHAAGLRSPRVSFRQVDFQHLSEAFASSDEFDVIVSRAALHWLPAIEHPRLLQSVRDLVSQTGWVQLEFGGAGNISRMYKMLASASENHGGITRPWYFPDAGEYLELCETAGLVGSVRTVAQRREFSSEGILGWMRSQGFQAFEASLGPRYSDFVAEAEQRVDEVRRSDGSFDLTYVRLVATLQHGS
ncbi:MAG: trans-aconitate 2-methyltransferase, partial [Acidimicrobiales bacterium]